MPKGVYLHKKFSEEHKRKISQAVKRNYIIDKERGLRAKSKSEEIGEKISEANKGKREKEKNPNWKGNNVGYVGLHFRIRKILGKPTKCEHCEKEGLVGHQIHWANKSQEYKKDLDDWIRLCVKCHRKYDNVFIRQQTFCEF